MSDSLPLHGLSPWNSPGQNTGVGSLSLLQGIFPTQGSNPGLPTWQADSLPAEPQGKPIAYRRISIVMFLPESQTGSLKVWTFSLMFISDKTWKRASLHVGVNYILQGLLFSSHTGSEFLNWGREVNWLIFEKCIFYFLKCLERF